jgi:hypothetical protein
MMEKFWKAALAIGGLGAIGAFVFWSLYKQWLSLPIFSMLSPDQTFEVMKMFLLLTFASLLVLGGLYLSRRSPPKQANDHVFNLHKSWEGINEIDCDRLIGPDVTNAVRAMTITASSWLNDLVEKKIILENHFEDFELLYGELMRCDKIVPGFEKRDLKCRDFISEEMKRAYEQMKNYKGGI